MSDAALIFDNLRKSYRSRRGRVDALNGLSFEVPRGCVFGFLGPNGSGKTTAIRAAVGHLRLTDGRVGVLGQNAATRLHKVIDKVGAVVEQPQFFPNFSGRENLEMLAGLRGFSKASVNAALERVGLAERADDDTKGYSLGMRQRLGIASVLLKDPELLILDEPANGLDPSGIIEMRNLIKSIGAEGRTVFVSSHILGEIQQTCDRLAVIRQGSLVAQGTVDELLRQKTSGFKVKVEDRIDDAVVALRQAGFESMQLPEIGNVGTGAMFRVVASANQGGQINKLLAETGIYVSELSPIEQSLEEVFVELTGGDSV